MIQIGQQAPDIIATDHAGKAFNLSEMRGKSGTTRSHNSLSILTEVAGARARRKYSVILEAVVFAQVKVGARYSAQIGWHGLRREFLGARTNTELLSLSGR